MKAKTIFNKTIISIYFFDAIDEVSGLKLLFKFDKGFLYFDSLIFYVSDTDYEIFKLYSWKEIDYDGLKHGLTITKIREDEVTSFFIMLSNRAIFYVYQHVLNLTKWYQEFEIVEKASDEDHYLEVIDYMEEDFVEDIKIYDYDKKDIPPG